LYTLGVTDLKHTRSAHVQEVTLSTPVLEFGFNEVEIYSEKPEICKTLGYYPNSDRTDSSRM
jgi:hypothetical protein